MAFINQKHPSWLTVEIEKRHTLTDSMCSSCSNLQELRTRLLSNISMLAESGYAEGQMCHILVRATNSEKKNVAISAPMVVK